MSNAITTTDIDALTAAGWKVEGDRDAIQKDFKFADFTAAFAFMTQCAFYAEKWDHHPEWQNTYSDVSVRLTTHDAGGLTELDAKLATKMDEIAG
ncbi:4a-hydroxytetrahydrobiopterin dehydratase [Pseudooceanicola sp. MF1-13]|uniref:4a-hydroxytetrahydrobiopterin dehydratase n=1 Tax=Pseudooceanicola sp. MF1-13 TaxID=3379095 RepID=UPI00389285BD